MKLTELRTYEIGMLVGICITGIGAFIACISAMIHVFLRK